MKKVVVAFLSIFMIFSCGGNNGGNSKSDTFFEGVITPGVLSSTHTSTNNAGGLRDIYEEELTINADHSLSKHLKNTFNGEVSYRNSTGMLTEKLTETFDGEKHVWYIMRIDHESKDYHYWYSIDTKGNVVSEKCDTWSRFKSLLDTPSTQGWHWKMTRK